MRALALIALAAFAVGCTSIDTPAPYETAGNGAPPVGNRPVYTGPPQEGPPAPPAPPAASPAERTAPAPAIVRSDADFVATLTNYLAEDQALGRLARERSANDAIRSYGGRLEKESSKALSDLRKVASSDGVTPPAASTDAWLSHLETIRATGFDVEFAAGQVSREEAQAALLRREAAQGQRQNLKDYASRRLSVVESRLQTARGIVQNNLGRGDRARKTNP